MDETAAPEARPTGSDPSLNSKHPLLPQTPRSAKANPDKLCGTVL